MTNRIRVAVVDDQDLVRGGLVSLLASQEEFEVVVEAADGLSAIRALAETTVDVVLMDVRMPGLDGIEATRQILAGKGRLPRVIMITTFDLDDYLVAALRAGASGFLLKDTKPDHLFDALRTVHRGNSVISPRSTRRLLNHVTPLLAEPTPQSREAARRISQLTERELEVFRHIAAASSNAEIAAKLHVSEATIKTHVAHILAKLHVRDRVHAVVLAFESRVIETASRR